MKITKKRLERLFQHVNEWPDDDLGRLLGALVRRKVSTRDELIAQIVSFPIAAIEEGLTDLEWLEGVKEELDEIASA